jgi:hypothetical protein
MAAPASVDLVAGDDLGRLLADLKAFTLSNSHIVSKPVDPTCPNKSIPFLMQVGTPEAMHLKSRIIGLTASNRKPEQLVVKGMPDDFHYYPSVRSDGSGNLDWGKLHPSNRDWSFGHKIDGSNLSAAVHDGNILMTCGSKPCHNSVGFKEARRSLTNLMKQQALNPALVYHMEFVGRLRHNIVVYERLPRHHVVVFDIQDRKTKRWFTEQEIADECARAGLEHTDVFWDNATRTGICAFLVNESNSTDGYVDDPVAFAKLVLQAIADGRVQVKMGGIPEGGVLKHRAYFDLNKGIVVCKKRKFVTSDFKEIRHVKKPTPPLLRVTKHFQWIGSLFDVPARFRKAYQRLRDSDKSRVEQVALALSDDQSAICTSIDEDFYKEAKTEVLQYLVGDFRQRCVRAKPDDVDLSDKLLPCVQRFQSEEDGDAMWEEFKPCIAAYARASFTEWRTQAKNQQWISELLNESTPN